jgi:type IV pilus assembly protein PilV
MVRPNERGYTAVELLMSIAVMAIGVSGIIAMQKVTATSNRDAKTLVTATHVGEAWLEQLVADSGQWRDTGQYGNTSWLGNIGTPGWFLPNEVPTREFGRSFDAQGSPVATVDEDDRAFFCVNLRLSWMYPEATVNNDGAGVMRAEVRVLWPRDNVKGLSTTPPLHPCAWSPAAVDGADGLRLFHRVHLSSTLLQSGGGS